MKVRILGCGTSSGVPRVGNDWGACDPADPRNRRRRVSIAVELAASATTGARILVDTGPDLREQLLDANIATVDAVIWTHDHADHCHGIDEVRQLFHNARAPVLGYARPDTLATLTSRFAYAFTGARGYPPTIIAHELPNTLSFGEARVDVLDQPHGPITSAGLVFNERGRRLVYATDFNVMTPDMRDAYRGADLWIVDALRREPHPSHAHLEEVLGWVAELGPARVLLTHLDQSMDYAALCRDLPAHVRPAHDGLEVTL